MNKLILVLVLILFSQNTKAQMAAEIGVDGIVLPRLTTTERNAVIPKTGQIIYNHDILSLQLRDGGGNWQTLSTKQIQDGDGDTFVTTEFVAGENIIRMDLQGSHGLWIRKNVNGHVYYDHGFQSGNLFLGGGGNGLNADPSIAGNNVMVGPGAGFGLTGGTTSVGVGTGALSNFQLGDRNVAIGASSMQSNTFQSDNIGVGFATLENNVSVSNIAIGSRALRTNSGPNNIALGHAALQANSGANNIAIGGSVMPNNTGSHNVALGFFSLSQNTSGHSNISLGSSSLQSNTTGHSNISIGSNALAANTTGITHIAIGNDAAGALASGQTNTVIGHDALKTATQAQANVVIGYKAMERSPIDPILGSGPVGNTAIGDLTMRESRSINSVAIGSGAMSKTTFGIGNVAVGVEALLDIDGSRNVGIGMGALATTIGQGNVALGDNAGIFYDGDFSVILGYNAGQTASGDNQLIIANNSSTSLITGDFSTGDVNINSILNLTPRDTEPPSPKMGTLYMDDGTNTGGTPTLRIYISATVGWKDL